MDKFKMVNNPYSDSIKDYTLAEATFNFVF